MAEIKYGIHTIKSFHLIICWNFYLKDIEDELDGYEDFEEKKLKAATNLTYEVVYKGKGEKVIGKASFVVVKYGSKWYIMDYVFTNTSVQNDEKPDYSSYY